MESPTEQLIRLYTSGQSSAHAAKEAGVPPSTAYSLLRRAGVVRRGKRPRKVDLDAVRKLHAAGNSISEIAQAQNCSTVSIRVCLDEMGLDRPQYLKHVLDRDFFAEIDTEQKAYWLGFVLTDGCVQVRQVTIGLTGTDHEHLAKMVRDVGGTAVVKMGQYSGYSDKEQCLVCFNSQKWVEDLARLGVVQKKSTKEVAPLDAIPTELHRHFWRGVIDGDGSISKKSTDRVQTPTVGLVGSLVLCQQFLDWATQFGATKNRVRRKPTPLASEVELYETSIGHRAVTHQILQALYGDCQVSLDRKQARADEWGFVPKPYELRGPAALKARRKAKES